MGTARWAEVEPETSAWLLAHQALSRLAQERAAADAEEGRWLLAALRSAAHLHLGFASFSEYAERSFGYKPRSTQEKLRVAEALEELPVLTQALEQGAVHWSALRELTRVRASYQIAVTVCAACGQGHQPANGELVPVDPEIIEMAHCDGQPVGYVAPHVANDSAELHAADDPVRVPSRSNAPAPETVRHTHAHVGATVSLAPNADSALARAKQTTPPALRRAVLARDHRRCRVPGCRNSAFVDLHHLQLRSEGGPNHAENLITVCGAHHRAAHRGQLLIDGPATSPRFRHTDGSTYGRVVEPQTLEMRAKVFRALRSLGFREADVHALLAQLQNESELAAATVEQWVRAALERLTPRRSRL